MLDTLIKIGKIQSQGKSDWDAKIYNPPNKTLLVSLIFDIDEQKIKIDTEAFDSQRALDFRCLKPAGARAKNALVTVDVAKNFEQLKKSLFGGTESSLGEFMEIIKRDCPQIEQTPLGEALLKIFDMKKVFENYTDTEGYFKSKNNVVAAAIQSKELGFEEPKALAFLDGFEDFAKIKILKTETTDSEKAAVEKPCYATGEIHNDVGDVDFTNRFSLNKMFVTTTKNYLSDFQDSNSAGNYQVSSQNQKFLEAGSKFVLDNWQIKIADINHCVLPRTFGDAPLNDNLFRTYIKPTTDVLFGFESIKNITRQAKRKRELFWLTFMAYESDGNFFKALNIIQDINGLYLYKIEQEFLKTHDRFNETQGIDWQRIMSYKKEGETVTPNFNFYTIYNCIPIRKDKEKKNVALALFKSILEQRKVDKQQIFEYFTELILCHRYERYAGYTNIRSSGEFDFSLEKSVFQYLAIIDILNKLELFKNNKKEMENQEKTTPSVSEPQTDIQKMQKQIDDFLQKMNYNNNQSALFYLGRALSQIAYEQVKNKHKNKPILSKINYHGMDLQSIWKLYGDLREKVVQYKALNVEFNLGKFNTMLNPNDGWKMSKAEALFYIMSGYSFRNEKELTTPNNN